VLRILIYGLLAFLLEVDAGQHRVDTSVFGYLPAVNTGAQHRVGAVPDARAGTLRHASDVLLNALGALIELMVVVFLF